MGDSRIVRVTNYKRCGYRDDPFFAEATKLLVLFSQQWHGMRLQFVGSVKRYEEGESFVRSVAGVQDSRYIAAQIRTEKWRPPLSENCTLQVRENFVRAAKKVVQATGFPHALSSCSVLEQVAVIIPSPGVVRYRDRQDVPCKRCAARWANLLGYIQDDRAGGQARAARAIPGHDSTDHGGPSGVWGDLHARVLRGGDGAAQEREVGVPQHDGSDHLSEERYLLGDLSRYASAMML
eukprot:scaffold3878_cov363-Prasinococcus_capsulatus_cf.AAC.5